MLLRDLSDDAKFLRILEELHNATRANERCYHAFQGHLDEYMAQNPQLGFVKLIVIAWDTKHIPVMHSTCFEHQTRLYSTKIHDNAIVKLVGCGMDGIAKFLFMLNASTSPSCNDQGIASYFLEVENNQGRFRTSVISMKNKLKSPWQLR